MLVVAVVPTSLWSWCKRQRLMPARRCRWVQQQVSNAGVCAAWLLGVDASFSGLHVRAEVSVQVGVAGAGANHCCWSPNWTAANRTCQHRSSDASAPVQDYGGWLMPLWA